MKTIYLLEVHHYKGSSPIKAFEDKKQAEVLRDECNEHLKIKPQWDLQNETFDSFNILEKAWKEQGPLAPIDTGGDEYLVKEIELVELRK